MGWWKERGEVELLIWIRASKILAQGLFSAECLPLCRRLGCGESSLSGAGKHQSSAALQRVHVCFSFDKVHFIFLPKFIKWKWQDLIATATDSSLLSASPNWTVIFLAIWTLEPFFHVLNQAVEFDWFSWFTFGHRFMTSPFGLRCKTLMMLFTIGGGLANLLLLSPFVKLWAATDFIYQWNSVGQNSIS